MTANTLRRNQRTGQIQPATLKKVAPKTASKKLADKKARPSTVELLERLSTYEWDFSHLKRERA